MLRLHLAYSIGLLAIDWQDPELFVTVMLRRFAVLVAVMISLRPIAKIHIGLVSRQIESC